MTQNEDQVDGCELDFTEHPTSGAEIEDYLIKAGDEEPEDDD